MTHIEPPTVCLEGEPVKLRPLNHIFYSKLKRACDRKDANEAGEAFICGYVLAATAPDTRASVQRLNSPTFDEDALEVGLSLSPEDCSAVLKYLDAVIFAAEKASVEVEESPGKSVRMEETPLTT